MTAHYIFGAGGHAHVIASALAGPVSFVVPHPTAEGEIAEAAFLANIETYRAARIYVGIGDNRVRRRIFEMLAGLGVSVANCVSAHAFVAGSAALGRGVAVLHGAVVGAKARIGDNTIINTLSSVDHDCVLGAHSQVTAGVTFGGGVTTGENCFFGIRSAVLPGKTLGDNVVVMAGALVTQDFPDNVVVGGTPARVMKTLA